MVIIQILVGEVEEGDEQRSCGYTLHSISPNRLKRYLLSSKYYDDVNTRRS